MRRAAENRLESMVHIAEALGRIWRPLPLPMRYVLGALIVLPALLLYAALGSHLPPPASWL
jgi:hypothetical protein